MAPWIRVVWLAAAVVAVGRRADAQFGRATASGTADGYEDCDHGGHIALSVRLTDAATGRGVPWRDVFATRVAWRAGRSADTSAPPPKFGPGEGIPNAGTADGFLAPVVWGRPGTYALTVTVPGYQPWRAGGVAVPQGPGHCDVAREVVVDARLQPVQPTHPPGADARRGA